MCQGLNSHYFHIIGDGHQPNSRGLYTTHYNIIRIPIKGGRSPIPRDNLDHGTYVIHHSIPSSHHQPRLEFGHAELLKVPCLFEIFVVIVGQMLQGKTSRLSPKPHRRLTAPIVEKGNKHTWMIYIYIYRRVAVSLLHPSLSIRKIPNYPNF